MQIDGKVAYVSESPIQHAVITYENIYIYKIVERERL